MNLSVAHDRRNAHRLKPIVRVSRALPRRTPVSTGKAIRDGGAILMAEIAGNLWEFNFARIVIVDVTDDYRLMQPPLPSDFYPVLKETWLPCHKLAEHLAEADLISGYLYDWHERPDTDVGKWYVGVVHEEVMNEPRFQNMLGVEC